MFCPKDMKPCCDDFCYGQGSCFVTGDSMYKRCRCGHLVAVDGSNDELCTCDPFDDDDEFEEDDDKDA
jgi:hypothetical protein